MILGSSSRLSLLTSAALLTLGSGIPAQIPPLTPDIPAKFETPTASYDYVKRDVMIPMRDAEKLHTAIVVPNASKNAPNILTRTPYNASKRVERNQSQHRLAILPQCDEVFAYCG